MAVFTAGLAGEEEERGGGGRIYLLPKAGISLAVASLVFRHLMARFHATTIAIEEKAATCMAAAAATFTNWI